MHVMSDLIISKYDAVHWMAALAAADGVVTASERRVIREFAEAYDIDPHIIYRVAYAIAHKIEVPEVEALSRTEMKGRMFEKFVVSLCSDTTRFKLLAWRGDKISGGTYALENLLPDLRICHRTDKGDVEYLIECKYRSEVPTMAIDISTQLDRYCSMSLAKEDCEIFIALGIGGSPAKPEHFYLIPCRTIDDSGVIRLDTCDKCICEQTPECFHTYLNDYFCRDRENEE